jgi:signal transduction histidine kinase
MASPAGISDQKAASTSLAGSIAARAGGYGGSLAQTMPHEFRRILNAWPGDHSLLRRLAEVGTVAAVYYVAGRLGLSLALPPGHASPVWPPSGVALAAVLLLGYRVWPAIWLGAFAVNIQDLFSLSSGGAALKSIAVGVTIGMGSTAQALLGAYLIQRFTGCRSPFDQAQRVFKFVGIETVSCVVAPVFGVTSLCLAGFVSWTVYADTWWTWWLGDLAGVIIIAPLILVWTNNQTRWRSQRLPEAIVLLAALSVAGLLIFWEESSGADQRYLLAFILIPLVVWAAFRFGQGAVVVATALLSAIAIMGTIDGAGPFARETLNASLLMLLGFQGIVACTGLVLAAALSERADAERARLLLSQRLLVVDEEQRRQLAYDLHDGLVQMIVATDMHVEALRTRLPVATGEVRHELDRTSRRLKEAIREGRRILSASRPAALDDFGLVQAVKLHLQRFADEQCWQCRLDTNFAEWRPSPHVETALFRIVQEALTNVSKHAHTDRVAVNLEHDADSVRIAVQDWGQGFDTDEALRRTTVGHSLGLVGMKERAQLLGGACTIIAEPGRGTTITVTVPDASAPQPVAAALK